MVSSNRRRLSRSGLSAPSIEQPPALEPLIGPVAETIVEDLDASTTGDSDSANPPSLPEPILPDVAEVSAPIYVSNPLQNLAPGVGGGNPLQNFLQPSSAPSGANSADLAISQAGEVSADQQDVPRRVDGMILEPAASASVASTDANQPPSSMSTAAAPADNIPLTANTSAPVIVRDMLPVLLLPAAVLPASSVQTDLPPLHTLDSNVMNSNVQSVASFATTVNATQSVVASTLAARYLLPHEKVRKLSKSPTHLEVLSIVDDLSKTGCPYKFRDVVPLDVEQSLVTLLQSVVLLDLGGFLGGRRRSRKGKVGSVLV